MERLGTIWARVLVDLLLFCLIMLSHRVNMWRANVWYPVPLSAHVGTLEGKSCSAGPLTDGHKSAESAAGFAAVMTKCYQL